MQRYYSSQWDIRSFTHPEQDPYKVSRRADGGYECSCKVWIFNRKRLHNGILIPKEDLEYIDYVPNGRCKHAMFVIENRDVEEDDIRMQQTQAPIEVIVTEEPDGRLRGLVEDLPEWKKTK